MATLVTTEQFATWCQLELADVAADPFAAMVLEKATELVVDAANAPAWELDPSIAPRAAKRITLRVARRTYLNPDGEVASSVGPISSRVREEMAAGMELTESEEEELAALNPDGDPNAVSLFVIEIKRGDEETLGTVVLPDERGYGIIYANEGETSAFDPIV